MRRSTLALIAALAAVSTASPAFAQTQSHDGSMLPHYFDGSGSIIWGAWGPPQAPAVVLQRAAKVSPTVNQRFARSTRKLYMMAPSGAGAFAAAPPTTRLDPNPDNPAFTGGGSLGYNQNLKNY